MKRFEEYKIFIEKELKNHSFLTQKPREIYEPLDYILSLEGKRIRPILCLIAIDLFKKESKKFVKTALALEFFHNFTLIHDDIMDKAELRKNHPSVHKKWDLNRAILSGDLLLIKSYLFFEELPPSLFYEVVIEFSKMATKLCQGQQLDLNLEEGFDFVFEDYLQMIEQKTALLLAVSLKIGALLAGAAKAETHLIYEVGKNLGMAFQIRDDYLDVFGSSSQIGKKSCGDLYENKKTILYFKAIQKANASQRDRLLYFYSLKNEDPQKVEALKEIFEELDIQKEIQKELDFYKNEALKNLNLIKNTDENARKNLVEFIEKSTSRIS